MIYSVYLQSITEFDTILEIAKKKNISINEATLKRQLDSNPLYKYRCLDLHIKEAVKPYLTGRSYCEYKKLTFYQFCEKLLEYDPSIIEKYESKIKEDIKSNLFIW